MEFQVISFAVARINTAREIKISIKYFFRKCDQIHWKLQNNISIFGFLALQNKKLFSSLNKSNDYGHFVQFLRNVYFERNIFYSLMLGSSRNLFLQNRYYLL